MPAKNMSPMQLSGMKRQFLPTSDIFATPKLAVRSLDDDKLRNRGAPTSPADCDAVVPRKGGLTVFNCESQQINKLITV